ncbi:glycine zipper 2TM domain protein [Paraburkholderia xenovorans LB400]|jgi:outer membrane lipoprotein SlyB|uniref:Membrane protein n=1 Tax=Paraburkholderia xenovorans (strain LB400) TaxID=266265 RepID=Q13WZ4_PARXL|nr:glycine zipper 2TM domain-containing protein [Paraburkholderia xenovorans]ABE31395.1 Putative membrane protein [Paraburkholderia xenovorans LB400]AIP31201.1 glycine zipper 2TM domain protein [Paraburkholderia xenovorans LB400]
MDNPNTQPTTQSSQPAQQRRLHPLIATAAGAVIIASLVATAAVTGLFPKASSNGAQNDQTQAAQVTTQGTQPGVVDSAAPANPSAQQAAQQPQPAPAPAPAQQQYAQRQQAQPAPQPAPDYAQQQPARPAYCSTCGTVEAISAVRQEGHGTGIGAVGGAVAGGVVGNQFGSGGGRTAMTILGALGGGLAGNSVEKHIRSTTSYSVRVRMENGKMRYFTYHEAPPFQQGQRVRVENGTLVAS